MGSTPRQHRYQIPLATRSTDISTIAQCPGSWVLKLFYESEQAEASYFHLGSQLHETIEVSINMDLDEDWALRHLNAGLDRRLEQLQCSECGGLGYHQGPVDNTDIDECVFCDGTGHKVHVLESSSRSVASMREDGESMLRQWFETVHPDSDKRLDVYSEYEWPPATEVPFMRTDTGTKYPAWGSIDALFTSKTRTALVDWKSGTSKQRNSDQMDYYRFGIDATNAEAWFHRLAMKQERSIIQMADPYPGDDTVRQRILATEAIKDSIVAGKYPKFIPSALCNWCPVQQFCPADGDYRNREENARRLRSMLKLGRGMESIEREVA